MQRAIPGRILLTLAIGWLVGSPWCAFVTNTPQPDAGLRHAVEEDWARQEQRWGRTDNSPVALHAALASGTTLLDRSRDRLEDSTVRARQVAGGLAARGGQCR